MAYHAYHRKILNNTSLKIVAIINSIQRQSSLPQELVKPISGIWLGKPVYASQWAGIGKINSFVPYLAGKGDSIAFDYSSKPITSKFAIEYLLGCNHNELVILPMLQSDDDLQSIFPLLAELMFHTNEIDVSDDNFRAWLIGNRPKVGGLESLPSFHTWQIGDAWKIGKRPKVNKEKMDMHEDSTNRKIFKFLQLKEHAGKVRIEGEMAQVLFKDLVDIAQSICFAHSIGEGDNPKFIVETDEAVLSLVNNLINSAKPAPKPTIFERVGADEINNMPREYEECRTRLVPRWVDSCIFVPVTDDVAEKCFGKPSVESSEGNMWFFKVDGVLCKAFGRGQLSIVVSRRPFAEVRKALDRILDVVNEEMNGKK